MNERMVFRLASASVGTRLRNMEVLRRWKVSLPWVFDMGCGVGVFCRDLENAGVRTIGMDYDYHKACVGHTVLKTPFLAGDVAKLPIKDGCLPAVLMRDVLEHMPDDMGALREVRRSLQKQGLLIITVPNHNWGIFYRLTGVQSRDHGHLRLYDRAGITKKLEDFDFTVEKIEYVQNPVATTFEFILIILELLSFGKENVQQSMMSRHISRRMLVSMLYLLISRAVWPFIVLAEHIFPERCCSEILVIARRR